jgi:cell division protein ZapA
MEASEYFSITLRLGQHPLSITVKRTEEEAYRAAERLINQRYNQYATQYPNLGNETYLCMSALNIALSMKKNEFRNDTQPFVESMERMLDTLNEALDKKP